MLTIFGQFKKASTRNLETMVYRTLRAGLKNSYQTNLVRNFRSRHEVRMQHLL
ncbi:hypothetical protein COOONC_12787 [Cooperia oncophora]